MTGRFLAIGLLTAALAAAAVPACADEPAGEDNVQFFHNIDVTPDTPAGDTVCFFCSVNVKGEVNGDVVVFFGNVRLDGTAHQDIVDFFGHVAAAGNSSIGGDLVSLFGSIRLGDNVSVSQDVVAVFGTVHSSSSVSVHGERVSASPWIFFGPLILVVLAIVFIVHEVRAHQQRRFMQNYPVPPPPHP